MSKDLLLEFVFTFETECFHLALDLFADECFPKLEKCGNDDLLCKFVMVHGAELERLSLVASGIQGTFKPHCNL